MKCQCKPVRWDELSPDEQAEFGNGCGPKWMPDWLKHFISVYLFGWLYEASCRRHDFGYARGGSEANRKKADLGYYRAMQRDAGRLANESSCKEMAALMVAWLYYRLVRLFGWTRFSYGPYRSFNGYHFV